MMAQGCKRSLLGILLVSAATLGTAHVARASTASVAPGRFALGLVLGEPSGISGKYWLSNRDALDMGLAFSFSDFMLMWVDYKIHFPGLLDRTDARGAGIIPYVGLGALVAFSTSSTTTGHFAGDSHSSVGMGLRIPLGFEWMIRNSPLSVFLEVVPGIGLVPGTFGFVEGGIGIRYYF